MPGKGDQLGPEFPRRDPGCAHGKPEAEARLRAPRAGFEFSRRPQGAERLTPVADPLRRKPPADKPTGECQPGSGSRLQTPGRSFLPGTSPRSRRGRRAPRPPPPRPEQRTGSRGPRKANKRPGRAGPVSRAQHRPAGPHRGLPYPEPRPSQPQPRRRAWDAGPAHDADSRPQSAGLSSGPAPGRSHRPLLKDRQAAPRTKPARGHMRTRRCQSRLAIQPGHLEPSNRRPGRAQVQRPAAARRHRPRPSSIRPRRLGATGCSALPDSSATTYREAGPRGGQRSEEGAREITTLIIFPGAQSGHATHLLRTFDGSRCPRRKVLKPQLGV